MNLSGRRGLNIYGDSLVATTGRHGSDIASQRLDSLDRACLNDVLARESPRVLDFGCGLGSFGLRCAVLGARVVLNDLMEPPGIAACAQALSDCLHAVEIECVAGDIRSVVAQFGAFEILYSQRMLHYLPYADAVAVLKTLGRGGGPSQKAFLSLSGLGSDLRVGYSASGTPVQDRFASLSSEAQKKHDIYEKLCLYSEEDAATLAADAGFAVERIWSSEFGNVKCVFARR